MADSNKRGMIEQLFALHRGSLQSFFNRRVRTRSDTPDLVQEVYLRMLRGPDSDTIHHPEIYLFTVARNLLREHAVLARERASLTFREESSPTPLEDDVPAFDVQLDAERRQARLRMVLAQLPVKCRTAVVLHYRHGLSYQQIAERIGVSSHMVKKYIGQALSHCRRRMVTLR